MGTSGSPSQWSELFPENLVPDVLVLIVSSWDETAKPSPDEWEVSITERFLPVLRRNKGFRRLLFTIDREIWLDDQDRRRMDLRFMHGYREDVYLAFECKRLNVTYNSGFQPQASEYVQEGMRRFVEQKYGRALAHGGMIGYVMDGRIEPAVSAIQRLLAKHEKTLLLRGPTLSRSSFVPDRPNVRETAHYRNRTVFRIHHLFLA